MSSSYTAQMAAQQQQNAPPHQIAEPETLAELVADLARVARRLAQMEQESQNVSPAKRSSGPEAGQ